MICDIPLLEALSTQVNCCFLSDMKYLDELDRRRLACALEHIPPDSAKLKEWNDALEYLARLPPEETAQAARGRLMEWLSHPDRQG